MTDDRESKFGEKDSDKQAKIDHSLSEKDGAGYHTIARDVTSDDGSIDVTKGLSEKLSAADPGHKPAEVDDKTREELVQRVSDATTGGTGDSFELPFTGRASTDRSIEYRTAEMRDAASMFGIDGAAVAAGTAPQYYVGKSTKAVGDVQETLRNLNNKVAEIYNGSNQQWAKDLGLASKPLLEMVKTVAGDKELGALTGTVNDLTNSVNTSVSALNSAGSSYMSQASDMYDKVHGFFGWFRRPVMNADPGFDAAITEPVRRASEVAHRASAVGTFANADGIGSAPKPGGTNPGGAGATQPGGTTPGSTPAGAGASLGGSSGGSGSGSSSKLSSRLGDSDSGDKKSSKKLDKEKLVDEATKKVIDAVRERDTKAGAGTGPANAVDQTVNDAAKKLAAGESLTPQEIEQLRKAGIITDEQAQALAAGGTSGGSMNSPASLDTYLSSADTAASGANPDLAEARAGMDSSRTGNTPRGVSPEARSADAGLTPAPFAASAGDPTPRRTALDANMKPLDSTGSGRVDAGAVPATKANTTNSDGSPRVVPTSIEVDGEEYNVPATDPRLMEMMNIVADQASGEEPVPVLEAARRAGLPLESYGDLLSDPLQARAGDVVVGSRGNGFYMGDGNVLMEDGKVKPLGEVLELRPPNSGIFRLALPELPEHTHHGDDGSAALGGGQRGEHKAEPVAEKHDTPAPPTSGGAPAGDGNFDPFAGGTTPPSTSETPSDTAVDSHGGGGAPVVAPTGHGGSTPAPAHDGGHDLPSPSPVVTNDEKSEPHHTPEPDEKSRPDVGKNPSDSGGLKMKETEYEGHALG